MAADLAPILDVIQAERGRRHFIAQPVETVKSLATFAPVFEPLIPPARYKGAYGERGSAKSWYFADYMITRAMIKPGFRGVCIREIQQSLEQSVKRLLEDRIAARKLGDSFRILKTHIETPGGGIIIFMGMQTHTAQSIKSLEGYDVAWVEEAQSLSQHSLDLLRPTIRAEGSELWFSWNPSSEDDPVDKFLRGADAPPDAVVVEANYTDNPWFTDVLRREMEWDRAHDVDKYSNIWLGRYETRSESRVFKNWSVVEFETPSGVHFLYGADWGFAVDPTVLLRMYLVGRDLYIDREAYEIGCEIENTPALFDSLDEGKAREWEITADSARPETISHMRNNGYPRIVPAKKGEGSVKEGVLFLRGLNIKIHPRCQHTIDEFTAYKYPVDKLTGRVIPELPETMNHTIDAARYGVESTRRALKKGGVVW